MNGVLLGVAWGIIAAGVLLLFIFVGSMLAESRL